MNLVLYRGTKEPPRLFVPKMQEKYQALKQQLAQLNQEYKTSPNNFKKFFYVQDVQNQLKTIQDLAKEQHFTPTQSAAANFAGPSGYVVLLQLPFAIAKKYYRGNEYMKTPEGAFSSEVYVIPAADVFKLSGQYPTKNYPASRFLQKTAS